MLLTLQQQESPLADTLVASDALRDLAAAVDELCSTSLATTALSYLPGDVDELAAHEVQGWLAPESTRARSWQRGIPAPRMWGDSDVEQEVDVATGGVEMMAEVRQYVEANSRAQLARISRLLHAPGSDDTHEHKPPRKPVSEGVRRRQEHATQLLMQLAMGAVALQLDGADFGGAPSLPSIARLLGLETAVLEVLLRMTNGIEVPKEALLGQLAGARTIQFVRDLLGHRAIGQRGGTTRWRTRAASILNYIVGLTHRQPRCFNHLAAVHKSSEQALAQHVFAAMVGSDLADSEGHLSALQPPGCTLRALWAVLKIAQPHRPLDHALAAVDLIADRLDMAEGQTVRLRVRERTVTVVVRDKQED